MQANDPRLRSGLALFEATAAVTGTLLLAVALMAVVAPRSIVVLAELSGQEIPGGWGSGPAPTLAEALAWTLALQNVVLAAAGAALSAWRCPRLVPSVSWVRRVVWGLGTGIAAFVLAGALAALQELAGVPVHEQEPLLKALREIPFAIALPWIALVAPLGEEVFFRGYLFRFLASRGPGSLAYAASALAFAGIHFNPSGFLVYAGIGLVLAAAYRRTGSLLVPLLGHAVHNGLTLVAVYAGAAT